MYSAFIHVSDVGDDLDHAMEFLHTEYSADHSALFRQNIRNLRYL
jgi:hypothetical protein